MAASRASVPAPARGWARRRNRVSPLVLLGLVLALVMVVDAVAASASYLVHRDDRVALPQFVLGASPRPGVTGAYHPLPQELATVEQVSGGARPTMPGADVAPELGARAALEALAHYAKTHDEQDLPAAAAALDRVAATAVNGLLPHRYAARSLHGDQMPNPWYSAEAQGLALSAAVGLAEATHDKRWSRLAGELFGGILRFRDFARFGRPSPGDPWTSFVDESGYLWFEEFPAQVPPSSSLMAHITTLFGIYDYWRLTGDPTATTLFRGGAATVDRYLPAVRVPGAVARNGLPEGVRDVVQHRLLLRQLPVLERMTGNHDLARWAATLHKDLVSPVLPDFVVAARTGPRDDVDAYSPMPDVYGFRTDLKSPVRIDDGRVYYGTNLYPELNAQYALAALDRHARGQGDVWLQRAERAVQQVLDASSGGLYAHEFPAEGLFGPLTPPWYSAWAQGLMLSAIVRIADETKEPRWRERADDAFATLLRFRGQVPDEAGSPARWISVVDDNGYVWFERFPQGETASLLLYAHLAATFAVYDYWRLTDSPVAARLFAGAVTTVVHYLPQIRVPGGVSRMTVAAGNQEVGLHRMVARQLSTLSSMSGRSDLAAAARAFARDA